ncbi:MAG: hypothetical protein MJ074_08450 [Oscillospiraceae bacterium]|nr:hypothetical protein [Oscillospiraceae bacterium]
MAKSKLQEWLESEEGSSKIVGYGANAAPSKLEEWKNAGNEPAKQPDPEPATASGNWLSNAWDKFKQTNLGGLQQSAGMFADAVRTAADVGYSTGLQTHLAERNLARDERQLSRMQERLDRAIENGAREGKIDRLQRNVKLLQIQRDTQAEQVRNDEYGKSVEALRKAAEEMSTKGTANIEAAKEGLGGFGQNLVDAGSSLIQSTADAVVGGVTGLGMVPFAMRAFGGATQQGSQSGASLGRQVAYGTAEVAKEVITEKMFNVAGLYKNAYGPGMLHLEDKVDEMIATAVKRFAKNAVGEKVLGGGLKAVEAFASEAIEEAVGGWMEWLTRMPKIIGQDMNTFPEQLKETAVDALVGGLSGVFGVMLPGGGALNYNADRVLSEVGSNAVGNSGNETMDAAAEMLTGAQPTDEAPFEEQQYAPSPASEEEMQPAQPAEAEEPIPAAQPVQEQELQSSPAQPVQEQRSIPARLATGVDAVRSGNELTGNEVRRIMADDAAMEELRSAGAMTDNVKQGAEGRLQVLNAVKAYAQMRTEETAAEAPVQARQAAAAEAEHTAPAAQNSARDMVRSFSETLGTQGQTAMERMYAETQNQTEYVKDFARIYNAAQNGKLTSTANLESGTLTAPQAQAAFLAGAQDAGLSVKDTVAENGSTVYTAIAANADNGMEVAQNGNLREEEAGAETGAAGRYRVSGYGGRGLRADQGVEDRAVRAGTAGAEGPRWTDEGGSGRSSGAAGQRNGRAEAQKAAEVTRPDGRVVTAEKVSAADLGIRNGGNAKNLQVVRGGFSREDQMAQNLAKIRGAELTLVTGGRLEVGGRKARALIMREGTKRRIFSQADDPRFSSHQNVRHEITHDMIDSGEVDSSALYESFRGREDFHDVMALYLKKYQNTDYSIDEIWDEIVCDAVGDMNSLSNTPEDIDVDGFLTDLRRAVETDALENHTPMDITRAFFEAIDRDAPLEEMNALSFVSLGEAAGFTAAEDENGRYYMDDSGVVDDVTMEQIRNSPIGAMIDYARQQGYITESEMRDQDRLFRDTLNAAVKNHDFAMSMEFAGTVWFTAMKANSDKQYGTTYDFKSICVKTQAVIDAMSAEMVRLQRGLKEDEIVNIYRKTMEIGNPVPCPECYVFARWIGIGGLLNNIWKYQNRYRSMTAGEVAASYFDMENRVREKLAEKNAEIEEYNKTVPAYKQKKLLSFGKAKGKLAAEIQKKYDKLLEKIEKAENSGKNVSESDRETLKTLDEQMTDVNALTWIRDVYFSGKTMRPENVNPNFFVPAETLFDLNQGGRFSDGYREAWGFRTTQGAGYGKAITPYADAVLGEGIMVTSSTTNTIKAKNAAGKANLGNPFLQERGTITGKDSERILKSATQKAKTQNFRGGQRLNSTSDAQRSVATDYLLAALEMQTMHSKAQAYTKVDSAVPFLNKIGVSVNMSLMPLYGGLSEDGRVQDTAVGGMSPKTAFELRKKCERAGTITIGVNDNHIRAMFKQQERDFIIPYHASGGKAGLVAEMRTLQENNSKRGKAVRSSDYTSTQGDKILSEIVLRWLGKSDGEIRDILARRKARNAILTAGKPDMGVVRESEFLSNLYAIATEGEYAGIKLAKDTFEGQIYPLEFWDPSLTYEESGQITRRYLDYCNELGFLHRFSGMRPSNGILIPVKGYNEYGEQTYLTDLAYRYEGGEKTDQIEDFFWKTLVDRRMYGNQGQYLPQAYISLNGVTADDVEQFGQNGVSKLYQKSLSDLTIRQLQEEARDDLSTMEADEQGQYQKFSSVLDGYDEDSEQLRKPITWENVRQIRSIGRKSISALTSEEYQKVRKWAYKLDQQLGEKSPFYRAVYGEWRTADKTPVKIAEIPDIPLAGKEFSEYIKEHRGTYRNLDTDYRNSGGWPIRVSGSGERNTVSHSGTGRLSEKALTGLPALIQNAVLLDTEIHEHHSNNAINENADQIVFDHKLYALGKTTGGEVNLYRITVEEIFTGRNSPNDMRFHNLKHIEKVADDIGGGTFRKTGSDLTASDVSATGYTVADLFRFVKRYDADFRNQEGTHLSTVTDEEESDLKKLRRRNGELDARVRNLKGQFREGHEQKTFRKTAAEVSKEIRSTFGTSTSEESITAGLADVAAAANAENPRGAKAKARSLAKDIISKAAVMRSSDTEAYDTAVELLKNVRIGLPAVDRPGMTAEELGEELGEELKGSGMTVRTDGTPVADVYARLQDELGKDYFPDEIDTPLWQVRQIAGVMKTLKPTLEATYSVEMATTVEELGNDLLEIALNIREGNSYADLRTISGRARVDEERAAGKAALRAAVAAERTAGKVRSKAAKEDQSLVDDMYYGRRLNDLRRQRDASLAKLKKQYADAKQNERSRKQESADRQRLLKVAQRLKRMKTTRSNRALIDQLIGELDTVSVGITGRTLERLQSLREWYEDRANNDPDFIRDKNTEAKLRRISQMQIGFMDLDDVRQLTEVLQNIENEIRNERRLIGETDARDTYLLGQLVIDDVNGSAGSKANLGDLAVNSVLTPERAVHRITGYVDTDPLYQATQRLSDGQRAMMDFQRRAQKMFQRFVDDKSFQRRIKGKHAEKITIQGYKNFKLVDVDITPDMRMALYLHSMNSQNLRHMGGISEREDGTEVTYGGVTIPDLKLLADGKTAEAYARGTTVKLTPSLVNMITGDMTDQERSYAMAAWRYFNSFAPDAVNDVSEQLVGYSIAQVENYFPINTDPGFTRSEFESIARDGSIEGMGFLKERVDAQNPILLRGLTDVLNQSIRMNGKYVGMAVPVRNINKLWNVGKTIHDEDGNKAQNEDSVASSVRRKWGVRGSDYIENFLRDVQNPVSNSGALQQFMERLRGRYAGAVLDFNAGVALKQAASYPNAAAVVGWGPLIKALGNVSRADTELIARYTPLLWYRSLGYNDVELGDIRTEGRRNNRPKALNWIQAMDVATTQKLWKAAEYYVRSSRRELTAGTDAYYREVANIYNRIIEETQPNYTTMQRPAILRSSDSITKMLNAFKTQPFQNANILIDAIGNYRAKRTAAMTGGSQEALKEAKRGLAKAASSLIVSGIVFSTMQFAWDAFRRKDDKYRDDDGELTLLNWLKGMGLNLASNFAGMLPFGGEALEAGELLTDNILKKLDADPIFGSNSYYGEIGISAIDSINDASGDIMSLVESVAEVSKTLADGGTVDWENVCRSLYRSAEGIAQFAGIPAANVRKDLEAIAVNVFEPVFGDLAGYYALRVSTDPSKKSAYYDYLYSIRNDTKTYNKVKDMMLEEGYTQKNIDAAMKNRAKKENG